MIDTTTIEPLTGMHRELERQLATKRDLIADTRRASMLPLDEAIDGGAVEPTLQIDLDAGAEEFKLTDHAHDQIAAHYKISRDLYDHLRGSHTDLLTHLVNGLMWREPSKRMVRVLDGRVRAFLSNKYRPRDNYDLMDTVVLPVFREHPGTVRFVKCDLTETRMYVKVALPEFEKTVTPKEGDVIQGGVIIQNSEVGSGALGIYPYTLRLDCLNGQTHVDLGQRSRHVGKRITGEQEAWELYSDNTLALDDAAFFAKCRDTIRGVLTETVFDTIVAQMQTLAGIRVAGAPDKVVEVFAKRNQLRESERGSMLEQLVEAGDLSGWGYVNALTATARDLVDADRQVELEKLAGRLTADPSWAMAAA